MATITKVRLIKNIGTDPCGTPWARFAVQRVTFEGDIPLWLEDKAIYAEGSTRETFAENLAAVVEAVNQPELVFDWDTKKFVEVRK